MNSRSKILVGIVAASMLGACGGGNYAANPEDLERAPGPANSRYNPDDTVFGTGGVSLSNLLNGGGLDGEGQGGDSLPVNKYLWQASLDTLSFLPLASTDPFTGVIATDWGATPSQPGERFKVTAYMLSPRLAASSLKVAVYREIRNAEGLWVPAAVSPDTARKLEDAILTRARQIRIAGLEDGTTG